MKKTANNQQHEDMLAQARDGLKLSLGEKLSLFAPRLLIGGIIGRLLYPHILDIARTIPEAAKFTEENTRGEQIWKKGDLTLYAAPEKGLSKVNEYSGKAQEWFSKPTRTALITSVAISVGIGAISTIRSINRYKREQRHLEKLYADKLNNLEDGKFAPPPPTKDDLKNLHKWRSHARNKMHKDDINDAINTSLYI